MSWCGGGEISPTPGVEYRVRAIHGYTLCPGSWPPSPGFAPWAILIWMSSALTRYSLGDAEPAGRDLLDGAAPEVAVVVRREPAGSSPPSPVLDRPPIRFMAMASVSWASAEIDPYDMAPVENRFTIADDRLDLVDRDRAAGVLGA